ncbi:hypothetical protein V5O48_002143, partial [Marasmius crinis-equi]
MVPRCLILLSAVASALSQNPDLGVPLSWRKFYNARPVDERIKLSQNAINAFLPQLNNGTAEFNASNVEFMKNRKWTGIGYWQAGNVYSAMANQDHLTNTTVNRDRVVDGLNTAFRLNAAYDKFGVITDSQANAPPKNFTLAGACDGVSMVGGVFWRPTNDDEAVNSITTGLYLTLSAYLAEITKDAKYTNASILSAQWIKNHNINSTTNLVLDTVNGKDCSRSPAGWIFTYNSGKYIEGLSVLADVTGD